MSTQTTTSKQFSLNWNDITKGLLMAVIGAVLSPILESLNAGNLTIDWKHVAAGAITAGLAYIMKNFFTPAQTITTPAQPVIKPNSSGVDEPRP